jgi:hypothetical protein
MSNCFGDGKVGGQPKIEVSIAADIMKPVFVQLSKYL